MPDPGGDLIILDMAMSVAARAKIRKLLEKGEHACRMGGGQGRQADHGPARGIGGFLLPVGGHKGYGLAVMVDLLADLLSGAAFLTKT